MLNQNIFSGTAFSMQIQLDLVDFLTESGGLNFARVSSGPIRPFESFPRR